MKMAVMKFANDKLIKLLQDFGKTFNESYIVGGILRDIILNNVNTTEVDIDIIVYNLDVKKLKNVLSKHELPFVVLDKENNIYRTVLKLENKITVTVDISSYLDFVQDITRRDFTINTLCVKINDFVKYLKIKNKKFLSTHIIDCTQYGLKDIRSRILRETKEGNIVEDPLRILRVARFMCYGFKPTKELVTVCVKNKSSLKYVAKERISEELKKIFSFNSSYKIFEWLDKTGILEEVIPELNIIKVKGRNTQFRKFYFHEEGLWQHVKLTYKCTEKVIDQLRKYFKNNYFEIKKNIDGKEYLIKYTALLHDIAKPLVASYQSGRVRFFHHEIKSANIAETVLKRLRFSNEEIKIVLNLIKNHMRLGSLFNNKDNLTDRAYLRLFRDIGEQLYCLLIFCLADRLSYEVIPIKVRKKYVKEPVNINEFVKFENTIIDKYLEYIQKTTLPRLVTGYDIMEIFKIPEGPNVGKILNFIREAQILGKVNSRDEALKLAERYIKTLGLNKNLLK